MKKITLFIPVGMLLALGAAALAWQSSSSVQPSNSQDKTQLLVTIPPQKQIVTRIAGDDFMVDELVPPGFSHATYDPTVDEMKKVAAAEMYFRIGHVAFEKVYLDALLEANPAMRVVDSSATNNLRTIEAHSHDDEDDHEEDEHSEVADHAEEEEIDPHVWLSPPMVQQQATIIYEELAQQYPESATLFEANYRQLITDLEQLDQELAVAFEPIQGKTMLVYHPAFGYLARDYGFTQEHIEIEGKEPSVDDIQAIIDQANQDDVRVIFVQKQFSQDSARAIADSIGGAVVEVDPLAEDYFANIRSMAKTISESI